jgi:hypothetical protein
MIYGVEMRREFKEFGQREEYRDLANGRRTSAGGARRLRRKSEAEHLSITRPGAHQAYGISRWRKKTSGLSLMAVG